MTVLSPYMTSSMLPNSSRDSRGTVDSSRPEKDRNIERDRRGPDTASFPPSENAPDPSKRIGRQVPATAAQIAMVMEEVSSMHLSSEDRNSPSASDLHCVPEDRTGMRRGSSSHPHSNIFNYSKPENSNRTTSMPYGKTEYRRSSNDSLNSVSSSDGYGKRGQMKPSIESYSEDDESKFCNYEKYPADLANKIHNANHLEDNDAELDTPINYSLKYSDEQLNSGRQSPSQNEQWARQKHIVEEEMKRNEHKQSRTQPSGYSLFCENTCSGEETHIKFQPRFSQSDCSYGTRAHNNSDQIRVDSEHRMNQKMNPSLCQVDDYEDDKPTNYSERYSEEEQPEEEEDRPTNYSIKFTVEEHHVEQPIDYSLKYATEVPPSSQNQPFIYSKGPSVQNTTKDHASSSCGNAPSSKINTTSQQRRLHPSPAQTRTTAAPTVQKTATCKAPSINQETMQTYCVEDTPICFSRCSSLSSLSSEDEMEGRGQAKHVADDGTTLQIIDLKENHGQLSVETTIGEASSTSHHTRMKQNRLQATNVSQPDIGRQKTVEFSSGAKSPSKSGAQTPKSPPEHYVQETPLVFSRCSSVSSLGSFESQSIASSIQSEPCSEMVSGVISPSDLPDSPGQTMPPSRSKTPPPQPAQLKREAHKIKDQTNVKSREIGQRQEAVNEAVQRVQIPQDGDCLMHFATENTPDGFSCASSLSALSLDEPFIQKDLELTVMPPVYEDDHKNEETVKEEDVTEKNKCKAEKAAEPEKDILDDDDDDDIDILEECINSAMPTKSSSKAKKTAASTTSRIPPPVARKPSQLPVYKLLSNQNRVHSQKHVSFNHDIFREDMPRVYCVEGTPINFSTATSLSDLTIESPPNELVNSEGIQPASESAMMEKRDTIPTEGRNMDDAETSKNLTSAQSGQDDKMEEGDILAECINSAMPKGKSHKPYRIKKMMNQIQHASTSLNNVNQPEVEKQNPTSPMKPLSQNNEYKVRSLQRPSITDPQSSFSAEGTCTEHRKDMEKGGKKQATKSIAGDFQDKPPSNDNRARGGFVFDSPHHYTPIEGTPYCFSRNDSLSSLDFDDDDTDLSKEKAELKKEKGKKDNVSKDAKNCNSKHIPISQQPTDRLQAGQKSVSGRGQSKSALQRQAVFSQTPKDNSGREIVTDEKMQNFAIEDTPVCFSRNSSLSSLSDIDQENNNKKAAQHREQGEHTNSQVAVNRPPASGYAPKSFHVEDTPVCFSRNSSLSSLSIDSEDDLLQECISSAMPKKKKLLSKGKSNWENTGSDTSASIEETNESMDLGDQVQSPISEQAFSPDSESFDWKAIQEGANSIVSSLHQAAACLSRQGSSDSDSILSLKSGISLGSPFHLTPDQEEKPFTSNKGPKIVKPGEKITSDNKKSEEENVKAIRGGKRVYKSLITGKARSNVETPTNQSKHSQQANMPMISRGRTMIHIPGVRNSSPSTSPIPKMPPKNITSKSPNTGQNSNHSSRGIKTPLKLESSPISKQTGAQGASSSKGSSRSGSRDSTPSRPSQQSLSRPMQSPGRNSISPGRNGISPSNKMSQLPRTSSPSTTAAKPSGSGKMSYTSPGRPLNQQASSKQTGLGKGTSSITRSESNSKCLSQSASNTVPGKRVELSRMSSTKSSGSESDRSERPTLMRQSTFIKEAPSPTLRRKLEESTSFESLSPPSRSTSPTRSQTQTPVLSPSQHLDVMPSHLPNQTSSWRKVPPNQNLSAEQLEGRPMRKHDIARSHSESPSRLPVNRSGTWKREHSKHSSSLPRVSTWRRTGSSSSILSASSESSEKAKSEDEKPRQGSFSHGNKQGKENPVPLRGTWRKIKDNEIPQINSHVPNPSAAHSIESKNLVYQMAPPVSKTEDVWVRIEDCPINNPRPGRSPTGNTPPVIDDLPEKVFPNDEEGSGDAQNKPASEHRTPHGLRMEKCLNSFTQLDSPEKKAAEAKSALNSSATSPETETTMVTERTPFSSNSSSKHNSPSGTVAARVTPFNYIPSPRKSSTDNSTTRPSQIPTPVNNNKRKESSKPEATDSSGNQSPKRHSGSYLVTSV